MKVSVISTVYNGEPYFDRALPSILGQTYKDFEYVIVDDGSTDRTPELLAELAEKDSRIRVISKGRLGRAEALNLAVESAQGEYIAQQDFDDRSDSRRLERQVAFLDEHPEHGVVGGYYVLVDENRDERFVRQPPLEHPQLVRAMARYIPFAHTVVTFRKQAWKEAGGYPLVNDIEDLRLWIKMASAGWKLANIPEIVGDHWVHANSFWNRQFSYKRRMKSIRKAQWMAIRELKLPMWMAIFPLGRYGYGYLPTFVKRFARRTLAGSSEQDLGRTAMPLT